MQSGQEKTLTDRFQAASLGEKRATFTSNLRKLLSNPNQISCHLALSLDKEPIALFAFDRSGPDTLQIPLIRVRHRSIAATLVRFLIFRSVVLAGSEKRVVITLTDPYRTEIVECALAEDGFFATKTGPTKISLPVATTTKDLSIRLAAMKLTNSDAMNYCGQLAEALNNSTTRASIAAMSEIERLLWPVKIVDAFIPTFIVPIRPEWARELFDESLAGQTLFGAKPELGLSREGVYYRSKNPQGGLTAPARVLWYVSYGQRLTGPGQIRACSRLDDVIIDTPKNLYRRFRRLGIYDWEHVFDLAKRNLTNEIMGLRFSDTELFTRPIEWNELQAILRSFGCKTQIQSPVAIQPELFAELYHRATTN